MTIRILLADDQALIRGGFAALIRSATDMEVVGEAADGAQALELARAVNPDIVLMDIRMPGMDRDLRDADDHLGRAAATCEGPRADHVRGRRSRAGRFAGRCQRLQGKGVEPQDLLDGIRVVAAGDALLSPRATRGLIDRYLAQPLGLQRRSTPRWRSSLTGNGKWWVWSHGDVEQRHCEAPLHVAADGQDPRQSIDDQTRGAGPGTTGGHRLPKRAHARRRAVSGRLLPMR